MTLTYNEGSLCHSNNSYIVLPVLALSPLIWLSSNDRYRFLWTAIRGLVFWIWFIWTLDKSYSFLSSLIMSHNDLLHLDKTIILLVIVVLNIQYLNVVIRSTYTQMRPFSILLLASPLLASPFLLTPSFLGAGTAAFITLVKYHTFLRTYIFRLFDIP